MATKTTNLTAHDVSVIAKLVLLIESAQNLAKTAQMDIDVLKDARAEGDLDYSQDTAILNEYRQQICEEIAAIRNLVITGK